MGASHGREVNFLHDKKAWNSEAFLVTIITGQKENFLPNIHLDIHRHILRLQEAVDATIVLKVYGICVDCRVEENLLRIVSIDVSSCVMRVIDGVKAGNAVSSSNATF